VRAFEWVVALYGGIDLGFLTLLHDEGPDRKSIFAMATVGLAHSPQEIAPGGVHLRGRRRFPALDRGVLRGRTLGDLDREGRDIGQRGNEKQRRPARLSPFAGTGGELAIVARGSGYSAEIVLDGTGLPIVGSYLGELVLEGAISKARAR
jgi:hypothetical protein